MPRLLITALVLASLSPDAGAQAPDASPQKGTGVLMGQVVDAFGRGVGDAVVTLSGGFSAVGASTLAAPLAGGPRRTITSGSGQFVFFDLPAGAYSLEATKPGFLPGAYGRRRHGGQAQSVRLADGERQTRLTFQMWEYATIGGRLTDESGEPLPGVTVRALPRVIDSRRPRWESAPSAGRRDTTDDRGEYRLDALPPGDLAAGGTLRLDP